MIAVEGLQTFPTAGSILLTTAEHHPRRRAGQPPRGAVRALGPDREVFPREYVYPGRTTASEIRARDAQEQMTTSQADAAAAALRAAGIDVQQVPMVQSVASTGPAADKLLPGDFVLAVDGQPTAHGRRRARRRSKARASGEAVTFTDPARPRGASR